MIVGTSALPLWQRHQMNYGMDPPPTGTSRIGRLHRSVCKSDSQKRDALTRENLVKLMADPAFDGQGRIEFYDLLSLQGQGAFGKVWKARHRLTGHLVAIKIYEPIKLKDQSLKVLLMNEIKAMKRVSHKHSMQFLESFQHHNKLHLVLEYIPGGSLKSRLRRSKTRRLDEAEAQVIFAQLTMAAREMHRQAVVHRDIKIENILFGSNGDVRLIDFGLSACGKIPVCNNAPKPSQDRNANQEDCNPAVGSDCATRRARSETVDRTNNPHHVSTRTLHQHASKAQSNLVSSHKKPTSSRQLNTHKSTPFIPSPVNSARNGDDGSGHFNSNSNFTSTPPAKERVNKPPVLNSKGKASPIANHSINLKRFAGTPLYMAPEVLDRKGYNGRPVDVWSIGVLLYLVLCGRFPFKDVSTVDDLKHIVKKGFPQPPKHLNLSDDVLDLLRRILCVNPAKRLKIDEVMGHKWLKEAVEFQARKGGHGIGYVSESGVEGLLSQVSHPLIMAKIGKCGFGLNESLVLDAIKNRTFNHFSTCYHLIRLNVGKTML